ncbi:hypothetical protein TRVL_05570 [Trypanosoma vivax]|nr:hypothetical protein TRVL_05570 [Trypanosoma vivax]
MAVSTETGELSGHSLVVVKGRGFRCLGLLPSRRFNGGKAGQDNSGRGRRLRDGVERGKQSHRPVCPTRIIMPPYRPFEERALPFLDAWPRTGTSLQLCVHATVLILSRQPVLVIGLKALNQFAQKSKGLN